MTKKQLIKDLAKECNIGLMIAQISLVKMAWNYDAAKQWIESGKYLEKTV